MGRPRSPQRYHVPELHDQQNHGDGGRVGRWGNLVPFLAKVVSIHGGSDVVAGHSLARLLRCLRRLASLQVRGTRERTPKVGAAPSVFSRLGNWGWVRAADEAVQDADDDGLMYLELWFNPWFRPTEDRARPLTPPSTRG